MVAALAEAARVTRPGGRVAVCNWGGAGPQDLVTVTQALQALAPNRALVPRRPIEDSAPFRRPDGSYLLRSTFRWVVAERD